MNNENICTVNDLNKPSDRGRKREIYPVVSIASVGYVQWKVETVEVTICTQRERETERQPLSLQHLLFIMHGNLSFQSSSICTCHNHHHHLQFD